MIICRSLCHSFYFARLYFSLLNCPSFDKKKESYSSPHCNSKVFVSWTQHIDWLLKYVWEVWYIFTHTSTKVVPCAWYFFFFITFYFYRDFIVFTLQSSLDSPRVQKVAESRSQNRKKSFFTTQFGRIASLFETKNWLDWLCGWTKRYDINSHT